MFLRIGVTTKRCWNDTRVSSRRVISYAQQIEENADS